MLYSGVAIAGSPKTEYKEMWFYVKLCLCAFAGSPEADKQAREPTPLLMPMSEGGMAALFVSGLDWCTSALLYSAGTRLEHFQSSLGRYSVNPHWIRARYYVQLTYTFFLEPHFFLLYLKLKTTFFPE